MVSRLTGLCLALLISSGLLGAGYRYHEVDRLLAANQEPDGVVFELMAWEDNTWDWASPMIASLIGQLRQKYPTIDIALVSHGAELFDLALSQNNAEHPSIKILESLSDKNVAVHVCGNYASFKGLGVDDFLPFVDVVPSGPAQVEDYIKLGFVHIVLEKTNGTD
jgi:intracellular sulfur oxidation DsrE/DsrF family protein